MDVRCSRCSTEYEFDDALISERGTTVKCTNCGFQFKIFPGNRDNVAPERWVVRTGSGRELVYTSLRELQRGIADRKVGPNDLLSRGKQPARPLGSIAELEPFFQTGPAPVPNIERSQRTLHGVAPPQSAIAPTLTGSAQFRAAPMQKPAPPGGARPAPVAAPPLSATLPVDKAEPPPRPPRPAAGTPPAPLSQTIPDVSSGAPTPVRAPIPSSTLPAVQPKGGLSTLPQGTPATQAVRASAQSPLAPPAFSVPAPTLVTPDAPNAGEEEPPTEPLGWPSAEPAVPAPEEPFDKTLEAAVSPRPPRASAPDFAPASLPRPRAAMNSYDELDLDALSEDGSPRRARSRWIAGVVFVAVASLLGASLGRKYLSRASPGSPASAQPSDSRVARFLANGARLLDEGDFEGAKEELDKASALAEKDPAVLTALARLETLTADVSWLKLRLLDPNSTDLVQATHRELGRRVGKARTAVDRAFAIAPEDAVVLRARIDVLRLSGDGDKAREWLAPLSAHASDPENAYVLAALDLAEAAPAWASVIDRLRLAASAEHEPGRASAALVYALVRAGKVDEAQTAFQKIDGRSKPHPLLEELRSFLARAQKTADAGVGTADKLAAVDPTKLPALDTSPQPADEARAAAGAAAPVAAGAPTGDFRTRLAQAASAVQQGDLARAEQLYTSVLNEQPNNTEALGGLGDVARRRHDPATAAKMYDRVLAQNPSYLPALLGAADQKWEAGDRHGALVLYRRLLEQAGPSSDYGSRAAARIAQGEGSGAQAAGATATPTPATPAAPAHPPASPPPDIDTTDLPGAR
ncbi:MAG TPA: zinc-ribbon domain-containing protein [Polyangiaceae bacterium]|jgi:predicted Zn finger-like uncharacterized protein